MNRQTEREYRDALDGLRISKESKERMMKNLVEQTEREPAKRRSVRPLRAGLIAAAVCVLLAGTADAVRLIAGFQRIDAVDQRYDTRTDKFYQGYTAWGGVDFIPLEWLSQEILDIAAENPSASVSLPVSSREELEALTGLNLPERLTLDTLRPVGFYASMSEDSVGPTYISYTERYRYQGEGVQLLWLGMDVTLVTERMYDPDIQIFTGSVFPEEYTVKTEEYTAKSGLSALITHVLVPESTEEKEHYLYEALFALDGAWYQIRVECPDHSEAAFTMLKDVLETFAL